MLLVGIQTAILQLERYLEEVKRLEKLDYLQGKEQYSRLNSKVEAFVKLAFSDSEDKIRNLESFIILIPENETEVERRIRESSEYQRDLRKLKSFLIGYRDEAALALEIAKSDGILEEVGERTKEELEAKRRHSVAEAKGYGSLIEVIDILRSELKRRGEIDNSIREIRDQLLEIMELLVKLTGGQISTPKTETTS